MSKEHEQWLTWLNKEKEKKYFKDIYDSEIKRNKSILLSPDEEYWFNSINFKEINDLLVIIIGDFPHNENYCSNGFAFSSLYESDFYINELYRKIYKDINIYPDMDNLNKEIWLEQGILCLPLELTIPSGAKNTHQNIWLPFTKRILWYLIHQRKPKVFLFLNEDYGKIKDLLWDSKSLPHLYLKYNIYDIRYSKENIFLKINNFIYNHYNKEILWQ